MKKLLNIFIASILLLGLSSISTAQNSTTIKTDQNTTGRSFVDKNNDGVCDNNATGRQGFRSRNFVDKNNDGVCDNRNTRGKNAKGRNFSDKNNDGICDNQGAGSRGNGKCCRNGNGCGNGNQHHYRNGRR